MAGIRFSQLIDNFITTIERYGSTVLQPEISSSRPANIRVITSEQVTDCKIFLWTITPGGGGPGVRPESERRIQMTNISGMPLWPGVRTLLGGWSQEFGVYAFWDARRHTKFSFRSPSLQVDANTLETAGTTGIATQFRPTKEGEEVVVAVAPGSLLWYVQNGLPLHNSQDDAAFVVDLAAASPEEERNFLDSAQSEIESARRYDLVETMRAFRDASFRPAVLQAYSYKCAVCNCDLKLVDAAHIVPITHPTSTDEVTNGIALCRLHHGAYDNALLGVKSDCQIVINPNMTNRLHEIGLDSGLEEFKSRLPDVIRVPASIEARPTPDRLRLGLKLRGWPEEQIA
ncbi:MAG: HNH endonuclease [Pirellulales bacterium]|nr:HNH endonuclease [Pirellulales bacterium]